MSDIQDKAVAASSYFGASVSVISGLTLTDWGILVGILTALLTFAGNIWYQRRKHNGEEAIRELERKKLELEIQRLSQ